MAPPTEIRALFDAAASGKNELRRVCHHFLKSCIFGPYKHSTIFNIRAWVSTGATGAWHPPKLWTSPPASADFEVLNTNWHPQSSFYVTSGTLSFKFLTQALNIICWVAGTNDSSTKCLMFQVLFFFIIFCKILCKKKFFFFMNLQKIEIKSFECPKSIRNYEKY